jgi:hypothetical protein
LVPVPTNPTKGATMPRMTKAAIGRLLADYDAAVRDQRKAEKRASDLKAEIRGLDLKVGTYGEMTLAYGTQGERLDQLKIKEIVTALGASAEVVALTKKLKLPAPVVPTFLAAAPLVVKPVVK